MSLRWHYSVMFMMTWFLIPCRLRSCAIGSSCFCQSFQVLVAAFHQSPHLEVLFASHLQKPVWAVVSHGSALVALQVMGVSLEEKLNYRSLRKASVLNNGMQILCKWWTALGNISMHHTNSGRNTDLQWNITIVLLKLKKPFYLELPFFWSELFTSNFHIGYSPTYSAKDALMFMTNKTLHFQKCYTAYSDAEVRLLG